jgi:TP901 family phage tail tape measure protein
MSGIGDGFRTVGDKIRTGLTDVVRVAIRTVEAASAAVVGFTGAAIKAGMDFDAEMSKVGAIAGATGEDFDALRSKAQEMGATTKFSATESAEAMEYMAMAGWKTEDMLSGISGIMNLAAAAGESLGTTSDIVTDALTAFGLSAEDSAHFADILAAASSNANTNVAMMGETFKYVAPVAGAMNYSAEDMAVAIGLMANSGIKASQAGTSLRSILTNMAKPTDTVSAAMTRLGVSLDDGQGNMYSFRDVMEQLRTSFAGVNIDVDGYTNAVGNLDKELANGKITQDEYDASVEELAGTYLKAADAQKASLAAAIAGKYGMSGLLAIVSATDEDFNKLTASIDTSSDAMAELADGSIVPLNEALASGQDIVKQYNGVAEQMADQMQNNLAGNVTIFKSAMEGLQIAISDRVTPALRDFVQMGTESVSGLVTAVQNGDWDGAIAIFEDFIRSLIESITNALPTIIEVGGQLIGAIGQGILDNLDLILDAAIEIITSLAKALVESDALQKLLDAAIKIITTLGEYFLKPESLKAIIDSAFSIMGELASTLVDTKNINGIIDSALSIIEALADGLVKAIPEVLPAAYDVILAIEEKLTDPQTLTVIVESALDLIMALADGLMKALPKLLEKAPIIIGNLVEAILKNIPKLIETAVKLLTTLADSMTDPQMLLKIALSGGQILLALVRGIMDWVSKIPETAMSLVTEFIQGIRNRIESIRDIGRNIIDTLKDGLMEKLQAARDWGRDLIENFLGGIREKWDDLRSTLSDMANTVRDFIGFSEPKKGPLSNFHTFAPDMMELFAKGIEDNADIVTRQLERSFDFSDVLADQTVNVNGMVSGNMGTVQAAGNTTSYGGITVNVYGSDGQDINELADAVSDRLRHLMDQAGAVYA